MLHRFTLLMSLVVIGIFGFHCEQASTQPQLDLSEKTSAPHQVPQILRKIPHLAPGFTQGLVWANGSLFESLGLYGKSEVRELDAETGALRLRRSNSEKEFGEGLALQGDVLVQLTYREGYALRYTREGLIPIEPRWNFSTQGWGLTWMPDKQRFARSNGSAQVHFHNAIDFTESSVIEVRRNGIPLHHINELEYARGRLYANVYGTSAQAQHIFEIDPETGNVTAEIDFQSLCASELLTVNRELNGIAYNSKQDIFYITGKNWRFIYLVRW